MANTWALSEVAAEPDEPEETIHTKGINYLEDGKIVHWCKIEIHGKDFLEAEQIAERVVNLLNGNRAKS